MWKVFDLETESHRVWGRLANPWYDDNYVVARGWRKEGEKTGWSFFKKNEQGNYLRIEDDVTVLVGHNIKFDLLFELVKGNPDLLPFFARGGRIFDTQYAEYLIRGMVRKFHMNSMDQIIESYGGRKKIDGMKELWKAGVMTSEIDQEMVTDYLVGTVAEDRASGDIGNTTLIYLGQIEEIASLNMEDGVRNRMDGLLATVFMEFHGIQVDIDVAKKDLTRLNFELGVAKLALTPYTADLPEGFEFNWSSNIHKSCLIYGGTVKYQFQTGYLDEDGEPARLKATAKWPLFDKKEVDPEECEPMDTDTYEPGDRLQCEGVPQDVFAGGLKKGQPKFKNVTVPGELKIKFQDHWHIFMGYCDPKKLGIDTQAVKDGKGEDMYVTDSDTLIDLGNLDIPFLKSLSKLTSLNKEIGTYYFTHRRNGDQKGMLTAVMPSTLMIHHSLNHTSTVTSRLSSSSPNLQNIPRKDKSRVKAMFVSRFGPDGWVAEVDYRQLEVVVMGLLSCDKKLVADLNKGVDFHCIRVAAREGCTYEEALVWCKDENDPKYDVWKVYRTECKIFSFQLAYGAGAATIALTANMTIDTVKRMMKLESDMYSGVGRFHASVEKEINKYATAFRDPERGYRPFRKGTWQSRMGTIYSWRSWDAPKFMRDKGIADTFSPPEIKNYPTQGTGGEIVQMILGKLIRYWANSNWFEGKAVMVNTVHDCVWFDFATREIADNLLADIKLIMSGVTYYLKQEYDWDSPVNFPVDVEIGKNMWDLKHWEPQSNGETI